MKLFLAVTVVALLVVPMLAAQTAKTAKSRTAAARVARGRYLVEDIGLCGDCHTPRDDKGEPVKDQWLKGATLDFKPIAPCPSGPRKPRPLRAFRAGRTARP
jgi:mono/diheme cytochrome c family protein